MNTNLVLKQNLKLKQSIFMCKSKASLYSMSAKRCIRLCHLVMDYHLLLFASGNTTDRTCAIGISVLNIYHGKPF